MQVSWPIHESTENKESNKKSVKSASITVQSLNIIESYSALKDISNLFQDSFMFKEKRFFYDDTENFHNPSIPHPLILGREDAWLRT